MRSSLHEPRCYNTNARPSDQEEGEHLYQLSRPHDSTPRDFLARAPVARHLPYEVIVAAESRPVILILDNAPDIAMIFLRWVTDLVGSRDIDVTALPSPEDVIAQTLVRQVLLVITEYPLDATMNGLALTQAIKAQSPHTRVLLATAYMTPNLDRHAREAGVDYVLPKPFPIDRLQGVVADVLEGWKLRRAIDSPGIAGRLGRARRILVLAMREVIGLSPTPLQRRAFAAALRALADEEERRAVEDERKDYQ